MAGLRRIFRPLPCRLRSSTACVSEASARALTAPGSSGKAHVIGMQPRSLVTEDRVMPVETEDGCFVAGRNPGLCKVAVVERHKGSGKVGLGILGGYVKEGQFLGGALRRASLMIRINIVCAGDSDEDMAAAIEAVAACMAV